MHSKILEFINRLTGRKYPSRRIYHPARYIEDIFSQGNCGNFALALKSLFPSGKLFLTSDNCHVIFKYKNRFYDIRGEIPNINFEEESLTEVTERWLETSQYKNGFISKHDYCPDVEKRK